MLILGLLGAGAWSTHRAFAKSDVSAVSRTWAASWASAPVFAVGPEFENQTIRQVIRLSIGGDVIRIRFSNENNGNPLVIADAHVAMTGRAPGSIDRSTDRALSFGGASHVAVPAGAPVYSDPLTFKVAPLSSLSVSIFVRRHAGPATIHPDGNATAFVSAQGNHVTDTIIPDATTTMARIYLSELDVSTDGRSAATVVTVGDSITDGAESSPEKNRRWPDRLAERLVGRQSKSTWVGVANAGISGNRLLHDLPEPGYGPSLLARLDRDVLSVPGLRWVGNPPVFNGDQKWNRVMRPSPTSAWA